MLALLLASPLVLGATARCAPAAKRASCGAAAKCCCGNGKACGCRAGSESPSTPQPAAPQRHGNDERTVPALVAMVAAQVDAPAMCSQASARAAASRSVAAAVLDDVVLRC